MLYGILNNNITIYMTLGRNYNISFNDLATVLTYFMTITGINRVSINLYNNVVVSVVSCCRKNLKAELLVAVGAILKSGAVVLAICRNGM